MEESYQVHTYLMTFLIMTYYDFLFCHETLGIPPALANSAELLGLINDILFYSKSKTSRRNIKYQIFTNIWYSENRKLYKI